MQTDMLILQDLNNGFLTVLEDEKSMKALKKIDASVEEEGGFLSAFTGLLNRPDEDIKMLEETVDNLERRLGGQPETPEPVENAALPENKTEFSGAGNPEMSAYEKKICEEPAAGSSVSESDERIGYVKLVKSEDVIDLKNGLSIVPSDAEGSESAVKKNGVPIDKNGVSTHDRLSVADWKILTQINKTVTETGEKTNIKFIRNSPEVSGLKDLSANGAGGKVLSEIAWHPQPEAGPEAVKKEIFDQRFDDKSGGREAFGRKDIFNKPSLRAQTQKGADKSLVTLQGGADLSQRTASDIKSVGPVFTETQAVINKDLNISEVQSGGENKETGHILLKSHPTGQPADPAGAVKGGEPAQKPAAAEVLTQIVDKAVLTVRKGKNEMRITLKPDSLGHLNLKIATENNHLMIKITADNSYVKELIEHNLHHLKAELGSHGLQIDKFDVFVADDSYRNGEREGNNKFLKMKNSNNASGDSEQTAVDEAEAPVTTTEKESGNSLVGVFA
jgi:hypothetical protein